MHSIRFFLLAFICGVFFISAQKNQQLDSLVRSLASQKDDTLKVLALGEVAYGYLYVDVNKSLKYSEEGLILSDELHYDYGSGLNNLGKGTAYAVLNHPDSARIYWNKALKIFEKLKKDSEIGRINRNLAILGYETGNYTIALAHIKKSIAIFSEKINDSLSLANALDTNSKIQIYQGNYKLALKPALQSLRILERLDEPQWLAHALNNLGIIEFYNGNYTKTIEHNKRALEIYEDLNMKWWCAQALNDIGNAHYYLEDYDKAESTLEECESLAREISNLSVLGTALNNLGKTLIKKSQVDKAIIRLEESLKIAWEMDAKNKVVERYNDLGNAFFEKGAVNRSIELYTHAIDLADSIGAKDNLKNGYFFRSKSYAYINSYEKAYLDQENLRILNDSLYNEKKAQQLQELLTIYETEKKEQQIILQEKEITVLEQQASISSLQKLLLAIGLLLSLIGFYAIRQKLNRNKLEKEKVDAELAFKKKELTTHALHLAKKNEVLEGLKQKAQELKTQDGSTNGYQQLIRTINFDLQDDNNWKNFSRYFEEVHKDFNSNVKSKFPQVTSNELRLLALLKMNLSSKEIANILNISPEGIKKARYRLRKKLDITTEDSLQDLVLSL